ncbi:MAG: hypothetical protein NZ873_00275 [Crenarchaeota archaeon]|nr:hypothetical protein [Thermoproteota archaeon]MDW8033492.1 hypothetical protein [Nitrososphaerota archaeon]
MQDKVGPANMENTDRIEPVAKRAEELSIMIRKLNTMLARGDFDDLKDLLNEIKQRIVEIENRLSMLDSEQDS